MVNKVLCAVVLIGVIFPVFGKHGYSHQHVHNPGYGHGGGHGGHGHGHGDYYAHPKYSFA